MKPLRQLCAIAFLTFMLASSAFAGDIQCGAADPPPSPPASVMGQMATGITAADRTASAEDAFVDPVTDFTLNILRSVLSLF